jgi:hypothetical protein
MAKALAAPIMMTTNMATMNVAMLGTSEGQVWLWNCAKPSIGCFL